MGGHGLIPFIVHAEQGQAVASLAGEREHVQRLLLTHGAVLFRGFGVSHADLLQQFCDGLGAKRMDYPRGTSPRTEVGSQVYTSTEVPANLPLPIHTEMSYTSVFPRALAFCCVIAPQKGGETPLADMQQVLARLPADIVSEFEDKGILYHQYCPSGHNNNRFKTWQDMFATEDPSVAERKCAVQGVNIEWLKDGTAKLTNFGTAIRAHPVTGERTWFNQAHVFHPTMSAEFRYIGRPWMAMLVRQYEFLLENYPTLLPPYPYGCSFGDGSVIPRAYILAIRQAIWDETVSFRWQPGDVLLVDNLRVGHGRFPFKGPRRILAALIREF